MQKVNGVCIRQGEKCAEAVAGVLLIGLHDTAFRDAIREDSRQTNPVTRRYAAKKVRRRGGQGHAPRGESVRALSFGAVDAQAGLRRTSGDHRWIARSRLSTRSSSGMISRRPNLGKVLSDRTDG